MADEDVLVEVRHPEPGDHRVDVLGLELGAQPARQAAPTQPTAAASASVSRASEPT